MNIDGIITDRIEVLRKERAAAIARHDTLMAQINSSIDELQAIKRMVTPAIQEVIDRLEGADLGVRLATRG